MCVRVLHLVLQFSEAVRVRTSSSKRSLPGRPVSTGRCQDSAMREKEGEPPPSITWHRPPVHSPSLINYSNGTLNWAVFHCRHVSCWTIWTRKPLSLLRAPHNQRMDSCCLRLVSHHIYHRKQHYTSCNIKERRTYFYTISSTVSLTLWWVAFKKILLCLLICFLWWIKHNRAVETWKHISGGCCTYIDQEVGTQIRDSYINNSQWMWPWYRDQEPGGTNLFVLVYDQVQTKALISGKTDQT